MGEDLEELLSKIREDMIKNQKKEIKLNFTLNQINMIITGLKMSNALEKVIDEEINIQHHQE